MAICFIVSLAKAQDKSISHNQLPAKAQTFIKTYYPQANILQVTEDTDYLFWKEYKVLLKDNVKIEFDKNGDWKEVNAERSQVPAKLIANPIQQYITKNFPGTHITQINKDSRKYEIELSSGLDLEFNLNGEFLRIDD